ncbi:uncharacterized protein LOC111056298 [Nilaparvata lugens]|uniref:uncharacterized protein LOC111056298 n=1 Tax=Nilaparvata lugens TaxID=108931 RepID=UPI00193D1A47|nr:uncharacterized protein LOC111056298 [Nilaparvata lugens]
MKKLLIGLGRTSRFERNYEQVLRVQQITVGGLFAALAVSGLTELVNIAILKLESPAEISWNVMPACFDSSILAPKTGHSFLSGVIVGRTNEGVVWDNVDAEKVPLRIKVFQGSVVNQGNNFSPIFTTNWRAVTSMRPVGSGFIVDIAGRKYILGVHVANRRYNKISEFNKVYFNSIGKVIREHLKESYTRT